MEPQRSHDLQMFDFDQQALQWTVPIEQMMTFSTWQFSHFLEWRYSWVKYGQHPSHLFYFLKIKKKDNEKSEKKCFVDIYEKTLMKI